MICPYEQYAKQTCTYPAPSEFHGPFYLLLCIIEIVVNKFKEFGWDKNQHDFKT